MKKYIAMLLILFGSMMVVSCQNGVSVERQKVSVGIMLSDVGLGDQSFSDAAFQGLVQARDELGIIFDYRELEQVGSYDQGLQELIDSDHDLIIGLGFMVKEDLEAKAKVYPDQQFILVDDVSELPNVTSVTFKEHEGSFLAGVSAALASESGIVGFVGGDDVPLINKFASGFEQGVKSVNRDNEVIIEYAHDFGNVETGTALAREMITNGADVLYAAAGLTGVGVLTEAQNQGIYSIGVDSDQYFIAEKSVMTSMMKHIDQAVYQVVSGFVEDKKMEDRSVVLGLNEGGVGLAPFRLVDEQAYSTEIERWAQLITNGDLTVQEQRGDN